MKTSNKALLDRITHLEDDFNDDSYEESAIFADENHIKKSTLDLKCVKCDYVANTELSLKKHIITKHVPKYDKIANPEVCGGIKTEGCFEGIEDIEKMFQLEIVEDEHVLPAIFGMRVLTK